MKKNKEVTLGTMTRAASFKPSSVNAENRTAEMVWSQGSRVLRQPMFDEPYYEELSMDPSAVRLGRLNGGAPLLNSHQSQDLGDVLGVVEKAWIDNGEGRALVRFSDRAEVAPIWNDVQSGIVRNVSVGYRVYRYSDVTGPDDKIKVLQATDWEPLEVSAVPVGADAGAGFRAQSEQTNTCEIIERDVELASQGVIMSEAIKPAPVDPAIEAEAVLNAKREAELTGKKAGETAERVRVTEITAAVRKANLGENFAEKLITEGVALDEARKSIIDELSERSKKTVINTQISGGAPAAQAERLQGAEDALMHRYMPAKFTLTEAGRHFRGMSMVDVFRDFLSANGKDVRGLTKMELVKRGLESTSDLPSLLANVANKSLRMGYDSGMQSFRPIVREGMAPDFKQMSRVQLGDAPSLAAVSSAGEFERGYVTDGKEVYSLSSYGKIVGLSRQAIINDDLNALTRIPSDMGKAVADLESDTVWNILPTNAAMGDAVALFHATHKNLAASGAALSVATMTTARAAMRSQKNLASRPINLTPKFIIVDPSNEVAAEQIVGPIVPAQATNFNPFSQKLAIIVEPRLTVASGTQPYYVASSPDQIDMIEICYLEGQQGAYIETRQGFEVDGMEIKVRHDFAAKALDWRGLYKNPGV